MPKLTTQRDDRPKARINVRLNERAIAKLADIAKTCRANGIDPSTNLIISKAIEHFADEVCAIVADPSSNIKRYFVSHSGRTGRSIFRSERRGQGWQD